MVASAVFITDLSGKAIISRNYRGDIPLTKAIERFSKYLAEVEDESKKPVFFVDSNGDLIGENDVGSTGAGGETFVYIQVCHQLSFMNKVLYLSFCLDAYFSYKTSRFVESS